MSTSSKPREKWQYTDIIADRIEKKQREIRELEELKEIYEYRLLKVVLDAQNLIIRAFGAYNGGIDDNEKDD